MNDFKDKLSSLSSQLRAEREITKIQEVITLKPIPVKDLEVQLNIYISKDLRTELKIIAAKKGVDLKKMVTEILLQYVTLNNH